MTLTGVPIVRSEASSQSQEDVAISVVLPCRNEEGSVALCVDSVRRVLGSSPTRFEVIVVDNGSSDESLTRAVAAGARVVSEPNPGYGNACRAGLAAARGKVVVLADADGTYDFSPISAFADLVNEGSQLVLGSRLKGQIEPGAMPWLHHRIGTPLLTLVINGLFGTQVSDVNCGIRAIERAEYENLELRAAGMEFASEMVVRAALAGLTVAEVPVSYSRRQSGEAKLRTWSDGWRHLRLVLGTWSNHRWTRPRVSTARVDPVVPGTRARDQHEPGDGYADRVRL